MKNKTIFSIIYLILFNQALNSQWSGTNPVWTNSSVGIGTSTPGYMFSLKGPYSSPQALIGNDGSNGLFFHSQGTSSHFNWLLGQQRNVDGGLEFTPSTAIGGTTFSSPAMVLKANGNIGIGTTTPSYKLDVSGDIRAINSWLRTTGQAGWYSDTYGGGIYMTDANYLRIYNSKALWVDNNIHASSFNYGLTGWVAQKQHTTSAIVPGEGWFRISSLGADRGQQQVTIWTIGGSWIPLGTTIRWGEGWNVGGISIISETGSNYYWTNARITTNTQNTDYYLELYFTNAVDFNLTIQYFGGYDQGDLYSGICPSGGGTVIAQSDASCYAGFGDALYVANSKNVGIGTPNPGSYKLNVAGKIRADEVVVNTTGADFVFEPEYKLMDLSEVEKFIKENKRLPGLASAEEMQKNGMNMSGMQTTLLQKIEELTIHIIKQNKKIELMDQRINELTRKNNQ